MTETDDSPLVDSPAASAFAREARCTGDIGPVTAYPPGMLWWECEPW